MTVFLNTQQAASRLGFEPHTLDQWRWSGKGPPFVKLGRWVRYRSDDLDEWISTRKSYRSTSEVSANGKA